MNRIATICFLLTAMWTLPSMATETGGSVCIGPTATAEGAGTGESCAVFRRLRTAEMRSIDAAEDAAKDACVQEFTAGPAVVDCRALCDLRGLTFRTVGMCPALDGFDNEETTFRRGARCNNSGRRWIAETTVEATCGCLCNVESL